MVQQMTSQGSGTGSQAATLQQERDPVKHFCLRGVRVSSPLKEDSKTDHTLSPWYDNSGLPLLVYRLSGFLS